MKNNKLLFVLVVSWTMVSTAFAIDMPWVATPPSVPQMGDGINYAGWTPCFDERTGQYIKGCVRNKIKIMKSNLKEEVSDYKNQIHNIKDLTKEKIQNLKQTLNEQIKEDWSKLDKEVREEIKQIKQQYESKIKELKEKFKTATKEERQLILQQIQNLKSEMYNELENKFQNNKYVQDLLDKWNQKKQIREQFKEAKENIRQQIKEIREQFKEAKEDLIIKYKTLIYKKFQNKIDNMSLEKLQKVKERIEKAKERFENMSLSEDKKTKIMSILAALDEVITEKLEQLQQQEQSIDTDDVLNNLLNE